MFCRRKLKQAWNDISVRDKKHFLILQCWKLETSTYDHKNIRISKNTNRTHCSNNKRNNDKCIKVASLFHSIYMTQFLQRWRLCSSTLSLSLSLSTDCCVRPDAVTHLEKYLKTMLYYEYGFKMCVLSEFLLNITKRQKVCVLQQYIMR